MNTMTKTERQEAFRKAIENGEYFEYECVIRGEKYVRNTRANYCKLLTMDEVRAEMRDNECFRNCFFKKSENPSKDSDYYFDSETDEYFAVKM